MHLHESVVNTMSGSPPETTGQNTHKLHTTSSRIEVKILDPDGNRILAAGLEDRVSTDQLRTNLYFETLKI